MYNPGDKGRLHSSLSIGASLGSISAASIPLHKTVLIDSEEDLILGLESLSNYDMIAMDAEGVALSRVGPLTVITFVGIDHEHSASAESTVFIVDVQILGERAFSRHEASFRQILEDPTIRKVTFDCRSDSDA